MSGKALIVGWLVFIGVFCVMAAVEDFLASSVLRRRRRWRR